MEDFRHHRNGRFTPPHKGVWFWPDQARWLENLSLTEERTLSRAVTFRHQPPADLTLLESAAEVAVERHGQRRQGITQRLEIRPLFAAAHTVAMLGADPRSVAAFLQDALEEGGLTPACIAEFGSYVTELISALSWPPRTSRVPNGTHVQRWFVSHALCAAANDPDLFHCLFLLLAERLEPAQFCGQHVPLPQHLNMARLVMRTHSPLARILATPGLDSEVQDAVPECLAPVWYRRIAQQMKILIPERRAFLGEVVRVLGETLPLMGIEAQLEWRVKKITSAYDKMLRTGRPLSDICDLVAVRVIVEHVPDCYHVQSLLESLGQSLSEEFDDYITRPKQNNYQSLHMVILAPTGAMVEIQIRTREMHRAAEYGRAAHCLYAQERSGIGLLALRPVLAEYPPPADSVWI